MSAQLGQAGAPQHAPASTEQRISGLDGFRGMMTIMVVVSHFFAEVPHGISALSVGYFGVVGFYVLSGFLIGRLILDKMECQNFVTVFYVRRFARLMPAYFFVLAIVYIIYSLFGHLHWVEYHPPFPLWTYATFTQNFYMVASGSVGPHWLAPTWTLAVEEHFYLIAPAALMFTPRRHLINGLVALAVLAVGLRIAVFGFGLLPSLAGRVMLPMIADTFAIGVLCAALLREPTIKWARYDFAMRLAMPLGLGLSGVIAAVDRSAGTQIFAVFGGVLVALSAAGAILSIMRAAPEAKRFENSFLCYVGHLSYCIYLTHLAILGLMHGIILGATPDVTSVQQIAVTILALPVSLAVGWLMYRTIEVPGLNYGRRWAWSKERRVTTDVAAPAPARA